MRATFVEATTVALVLMSAATASQAQVVAGNGNGNGNGNGVVTIQGRRQAPAVLAPGLAAAGIESCLGSTSTSTSIGGAGPGFGVTIGGTTTDRGCNLRLYSRTLFALGHRVAATQILCNDPDVAQALLAEGILCRAGPGAEAQRAAGAAAEAAYVVPEPDFAAPNGGDMVDQVRGRTSRTGRRARKAASQRPPT